MTRLDVIDPVRAKQLRALGLSWREIGKIIANEQMRPVAYWTNSVKAAVAKYDKEQSNV